MGRGEDGCKCGACICLAVSAVLGVSLIATGVLLIVAAVELGFVSQVWFIFSGILAILTGCFQVEVCVLGLKNGIESHKAMVMHIVFAVLCLIVLILTFLEHREGIPGQTHAVGIGFAVVDMILCIVAAVFFKTVFK